MSGLSVYLLIQLVKDETILAFFARLSWQLVVRFSDLVLAPARRHSPGHWWGQPRTLAALALSAALDIVKSNTKAGHFLCYIIFTKILLQVKFYFHLQSFSKIRGIYPTLPQWLN